MADSSLPTTLCAGCGKPMAWVKRFAKVDPSQPNQTAPQDPAPANVPIDPRAVCYLVIGTNAGNTKAYTLREFFEKVEYLQLREKDEHGDPRKVPTALIRMVAVTHFATCPHVRAFSGKRRKETAGTPPNPPAAGIDTKGES
jgi:hypothetical protein